jgi:cytochrome c peroxidase
MTLPSRLFTWRRAFGAAVILALGALALAVATGDKASEAVAGNPHAMVGKIPQEEMDRILRAVEAANTSTSRAALIAKGRELFRSTAMAKSGESCQSCHNEGGGTNPGLGIIVHTAADGDFKGPRDAPSLWGVARTGPWGWAGQAPTLEAFLVSPVRGHFKDGATQQQTTTDGQIAALAAYLRTLEPPASRFDQGPLSPEARRGEDLFQGKAGCIACHIGPLLTDNAVHALGVPPVNPSTDTDTGAATTGLLKDAFNTPQLRDVRNTAPYMHNGRFQTLRDVVQFYDSQSIIAPLQLTPQEIDDVVAYLESL